MIADSLVAPHKGGPADSAYFFSNLIQPIPFHLGGELCLGLYLACTLGCTLLLDHFWLLLPAFNPHRQKYENDRPNNKINTARRRRRRDNNLTNQLFFQLWSGLVIQKPWGCTRGCDAQALAQALKNATVSYFCLYAVVPWVVRSPEIQLLSNLVLTNVSHFCLCWGLYEGCAGFF